VRILAENPHIQPGDIEQTRRQIEENISIFENLLSKGGESS